MMKIDVAAPAFALGESRAFAFTASPVSLDMGADAPQFRGDICVAGTVMNAIYGLIKLLVLFLRALRTCASCPKRRIYKNRRSGYYEFCV